MSLPPVTPNKTTSGIAVDPRTLDRVVPESRRPDGSIRKEIKIRPGFTPQEDITRFRGTRQAQMDQNTLPKGHILGWVAPTSAAKPKSGEPGGTMSKSTKKYEKRKEKREKMKQEAIRANWEEDDVSVVKDPDGAPNWAETSKAQAKKADAKESQVEKTEDNVTTDAGDLGQQLEKLDIR